MKLLRVLDKTLLRIELVLLVTFLGVMVTLAFAQVVLRNLLGLGYPWADTIVRHLVLWVGFMGAAMATSDDRHISIDALTKFIPARVKHAVTVFTSLFAVLVCVYLTRAAWQFLLDEKSSGELLVLSIPTWIAVLIIPMGYALLSVHFFVKVVDNAVGALKRPAEVL